MKKCTRCGILQEVECFVKDSNSKDGLKSACKSCIKEYRKVYNKSPKGIEVSRKYTENTYQKHLTYNRKYYQQNKEAHLDRIRAYMKSIPKETKRKYELKYKQNNPQHKIKNSVRSRVWYELTNKNIKKEYRSKEYLGCSILQYKKYLEDLFDQNMSWENYGSYWEIDHIIPLSSFNLTEIQQQLQAFHYTNTQPLKVSENRRKKDKMI